jgi:hypothetical protein
MDWLLHHVEMVDHEGTVIDRELVLGHTHDDDEHDDHDHGADDHDHDDEHDEHDGHEHDDEGKPAE